MKMVETVEDMNSLDDKLFGDTFKRNPPLEDGKKRITFADENDPLADLLADKDDFLSSQRNPPAVRDKRSVIDNLFDIKVSNESLSSLKPGADKPIKTSDDKSKKLSLMQDLFGDTLHTSPSKESNTSKKFVPIDQQVSTTQYATEVSKTQTQHSVYAPTAFVSREPRRGKRTSEIINDPLGLLSLSVESTQTQQTTTERRTMSADSNRQKSDTKEYLPDWLEMKKPLEDKNVDYAQDKVVSTAIKKHRRSSSDKNIQRGKTKLLI